MSTTTVRVRAWFIVAAASALMLVLGVWSAQAQQQGQPTQRQRPRMRQEPGARMPIERPTRGIAVIHPTQGSQVRGVVRFVESAGAQMRVVGWVEGLEPNSEHGFHVHQYGDCSAPDATSAGDHYNPEGHPHALPPGQPRHAGDFGNIKANAQGRADFDIQVENLTLNRRLNPILGRAVIVHAQPDDGGQPTGNAGARLGCGVIGVENPNSTTQPAPAQ